MCDGKFVLMAATRARHADVKIATINSVPIETKRPTHNRALDFIEPVELLAKPRVTRDRNLGAINRRHISGAGFWYVCHANLLYRFRP